MLDTVNFWLSQSGINEQVLQCLSNVCEHSNERQGYSCSGKFGDYTITCYNGGISLKGSLAKLYLPSNVYTHTRQTISEAIKLLSDALHLDIMRAKVTRLDISTVITTRLPPKEYYPCLGDKPHFTRLQTSPTTLYYNTKKRQVVFYDKTKEAQAKGAVIPETLQGCNLFRYELRLTKELVRQLHTAMPYISGAMLSDSEFYYNLIQLWKNEFDTIKKLNTFQTTMENIKTPKEAQTALFASLLQQQGANCIDEYINTLKANKAFADAKYYSRLKADLYKIVQSNTMQDNELVKELETAINNVAKYAR